MVKATYTNLADIYGGTNRLLQYLSKQNNIVVHHVDTTDINEVAKVLSENTKLILLETPTNPMMKVCDIRTVSAFVHNHNQKALVVVDNTMLSPYLQNPLQLGADIVYHSGTKYLSGHHDLMAGVIGVKDPQLGQVKAY